MSIIYFTKDQLVCNLFTEEVYYTTLIISDEQFKTIQAFPDYHAWRYDEQTDSFTLVPLLSETAIRNRRQAECFNIIDAKSRLWWDNLTTEEYNLIKKWYQDWLDAPATKSIPELPKILK
jgi:hypothetical protein